MRVREREREAQKEGSLERKVRSVGVMMVVVNYARSLRPMMKFPSKMRPQEKKKEGRSAFPSCRLPETLQLLHYYTTYVLQYIFITHRRPSHTSFNDNYFWCNIEVMHLYHGTQISTLMPFNSKFKLILMISDSPATRGIRSPSPLYYSYAENQQATPLMATGAHECLWRGISAGIHSPR